MAHSLTIKSAIDSISAPTMPASQVMRKILSIRWLLAALLSHIAVAGGQAGQSAPTSPTATWTKPKPPFQIGYIHPETTGPLNALWFRQLERSLEADPPLRKALETEGYEGIRVVAAEGYNDLVRRMQSLELDCVFCPAVAFAEQPVDYTVVFQIKGPNDPGAHNYIFRKGVIIVGPRHALFRPPDQRSTPVPRELIARHFASEPVALVSRYSAPGWIYPVYELSQTTVSAWPRRPVFCGSSEEVVKRVLSGIVSIGACEQGALEEVLQRHNINAPIEQAADILHITSGSPTDPIVFRSEFRPEKSELGRRLQNALEEAFRRQRPGPLSLRRSDDGAFKDLQNVVDKFRELRRGDGRP